LIPDNLHDFFIASASAAGALIGLLFVAISVAREKVAEHADTQVNRIRAHAALNAFTNALAVSLFALIPGLALGSAVLAVSIVGLVFVLASLVSLVPRRGRRSGNLRDALFLVGLTITFAVQLVQGLHFTTHTGTAGAAQATAILVVLCFLIGIDRSWELIGGPAIGISHELRVLLRAGPPGTPAGRPGTPADQPGAPDER
jgi:hypothetical protein